MRNDHPPFQSSPDQPSNPDRPSRKRRRLSIVIWSILLTLTAAIAIFAFQLGRHSVAESPKNIASEPIGSIDSPEPIDPESDCTDGCSDWCSEACSDQPTDESVEACEEPCTEVCNENCLDKWESDRPISRD